MWRSDLPTSAPENEVPVLILLLSFAVVPPRTLSLQHWPPRAELLQGVSTERLVCTYAPLPYPPLHTALLPLPPLMQEENTCLSA